MFNSRCGVQIQIRLDLPGVCLLIASAGVFASAPIAFAQLTRFAGDYPPETNGSSVDLRLRETNDSNRTISATFFPAWSFDLTTDGQSVAFNTFHASFSGTVHPASNPFVSLEFDFAATATGTFDLNPISTSVWDVAPFQMSGTISGIYRSFDFAQPFSTALTVVSSTDTFETQLAFDLWPNQLRVFRPNSTTGSSDNTMTLDPTNTTLVEPFLELHALIISHPTNITLSPAPLSIAFNGDFDGDHDADGDDFLVWQQQFGMTGANHSADANGSDSVDAADLLLWSENFGSVSPIALRVPEPSALVIVVGLMFVGAKPKWHRTPLQFRRKCKANLTLLRT